MIENNWLYPTVFALAITIHNIEESIWLPNWSQSSIKYYKPVQKEEFRFAVSVITFIAYVISVLVILCGIDSFAGKIFIGFMGAMFLNAIFPHLILTILTRKYAPGVVSGVVIHLPLFGWILRSLLKSSVVSFQEIILYTLMMSILLLAVIKPLFGLGRWFFHRGASKMKGIS